MSDYDSLEGHRVKHLELIQAVITRLAGNSFLIKGWAVTVAGVFFGLAVNQRLPGLARVSAIPTVLFWWLDSCFLRDERLFRLLHDRVRHRAAYLEPFAMDATSAAFQSRLTDHEKRSTKRVRVSLSLTLLLTYAGLVTSALVLAAAIQSNHH